MEPPFSRVLVFLPVKDIAAFAYTRWFKLCARFPHQRQRRNSEACMRKSKFQILVVLSVVFALLLIAGCKKSEPVTTAAPAAAAAPAATTPAPAQPAPAPEPPTPSFSAAQNIGMFVYPKNNQDHNQQLRDEYDCYTVVEEQTG